MKKLVSSNEAATILGLSLQGVHYRIKKGQLESVKKDGKIYVYVDKTTAKNQHTVEVSAQNTEHTSSSDIVKAKDEQIEILKKTIKFIKKQYGSEIHRLERNQEKILNVFQSEVDLLKSAFNEMKNIYQLEHTKVESFQKESNIETFEEEKKFVEFMSIKDFFIFMKQHNKSDSQIKQIILEKVKKGDKRFIYDKKTKDLIICKSDFIDLI